MCVVTYKKITQLLNLNNFICQITNKVSRVKIKYLIIAHILNKIILLIQIIHRWSLIQKIQKLTLKSSYHYRQINLSIQKGII